MAKKTKKTIPEYHSFYEDGIHYMECKSCGEYVRNTSENAITVECGLCTSTKIPLEQTKSAYTPTGRPAGWHWMAEFVDKDGSVFHKGKEQPKLKGTLPPTKIKSKKKSKKRRNKEQILVARYKEKKLAIKKQKKAVAKKNKNKI